MTPPGTLAGLRADIALRLLCDTRMETAYVTLAADDFDEWARWIVGVEGSAIRRALAHGDLDAALQLAEEARHRSPRTHDGTSPTRTGLGATQTPARHSATPGTAEGEYPPVTSGALPPPVVPRCDTCRWYRSHECTYVQAGRPGSTAWIQFGQQRGDPVALIVTASHHCAAWQARS